MPLKILVVDDHEPSARILMWAMQPAGYDAKFALNGFDALEIINIYLPDIKTAWNSESRKNLSRNAGFHHHLAKPIDIEILLRIIHKEFQIAIAG